ncbi:MAG: ABC transporter permease subunit [Terriglobia bacterium]
MREKRRTLPMRIASAILSLVLIVLLGGFAAAALVRYSPGFDIDENAWTPKFSAATLEAMHARKGHKSSLPIFYLRYLRAALRGDPGQSDSLNVPVKDLLWQRAPVSARLIVPGTVGGLLLGAFCAWLAVWPRLRAVETLTVSANGLLLAIPPAVLGLFFFFAQSPIWLAVSLALLPRVFGTMRALLTQVYHSPALLAARARGIGSLTLAWRYGVRPIVGPLIALTGVSLVLAFGVIVPIESLCDVPGIGQLAWKAALARDLPLLSALALMITFAVASVHTLAEIAEAAEIAE